MTKLNLANGALNERRKDDENLRHRRVRRKANVASQFMRATSGRAAMWRSILRHRVEVHYEENAETNWMQRQEKTCKKTFRHMLSQWL
jgi:hypothetical protein